MNLTPHFTLEELTHSDLAVRLGIDNTPPAIVIPHLVVLARGLEDVRDVVDHPLRVNSGYRCEALERVLCAKDFAAWCARHRKDPATAWPEYFARKGHPQGYCADFTCREFGTPRDIILECQASGLSFDQLIEEGTWCHGSWAPALRGQILTARFDASGTPVYTNGLTG